jgi:precorrin-3B synthase
VTIRPDADRCPGVLRPHQAVDGAMLRVRIPGGRISAAALQRLSTASTDDADGDIHLTSRANLQLRGVRTTGDGAVGAGLVTELAGAGLLPHPTHERVRNIVCSPLTGLVGGRADLRALVGELDGALCAAPELARLPGPFLFALDDGRGDAGIARADLAVEAVDAGRGRIWVGGRPGPLVPLLEAVPTMIELARRFVRVSAAGAPVWHVRELPAGGTELLPGLVGAAGPVPSGGPAPLGVLGQLLGQNGRGVLASVLAPLGRLIPEQVQVLAGAATRGSGTLIVTPWRGVLVPDLPVDSAADVLADLTGAGLVADDASPWRGVTACPGSPRCARGTGDTEVLARRVAVESARPSALPVHVVACPRACGRPATRHVLAVVDRLRVQIRCDEGTVDASMPRAAAVIGARRNGVRP